MKRPLFFLAVVMTLGIYFITGFGDRPDALSGRRPDFRTSLEASGNAFLDGTIEGTVTSAGRKGDRYLLKVRPDGENGAVAVYADLSREEAEALLGSSATFSGRYFLFRKATDFGEFDVRTYYDAVGIAGGFLAETWKRTGGRQNVLPVLAFRIRERIRETVERYAEEHAGFYESAFLSDRTNLQEDLKSSLSKAGVAALLSSSGFFFSLFGISLWTFLKKRLKHRHTAFLLSAGAMTLLGTVTGFSFSFLRALIVFSLKTFAPVVRRKFDLLSAASLSLLLLLLSNPVCVYLSAYLYTLALLFALGMLFPALEAFFFRLNRGTGAFFRLVSLKLSILPVQLSLTYVPGLYAVLAESLLFAVRAVSAAVTFIALVSELLFGAGNGLSASLFLGNGVLIDALEAVLRVLGRLPGAEIVNGCPSFFRLFFYGALVGAVPLVLRVLTLKRKYVPENEERLPGKKAKLLVGVLLAGLYVFGVTFLISEPLKEEETRFIMADVGQGDGFLLESGKTVILVDGGSSDNASAGDLLIGTLRYFGHGSVDAVFISHDDADHTSGIEELLDSGALQAGRIYLPETAMKEKEFVNLRRGAEESGIPVGYLKKGDALQIGGIGIRVLFPEEHARASGNETSMVLYVQTGEASFLFTGDVSSEEERRIELPDRADVLKVAHHGSKYSSSEEFLRTVRPAVAAASYGNGNSYGHPAKETLERLRSVNASVFLSGRDGAVSFLFRDGGLEIRSPRGAVLTEE